MPHWFQRLASLRAGAALAVFLMAGAGALAQEEDGVVATIDGETVTEAELELAMSDLGEQFAQLSGDQKRAAALSALIEIKLLSAEASDLGLADDAAFQQRMTFLRERALHSAYIENEVDSNLTEEEMRARYDEEIAGIEPAEEIRARHILVESEEEAVALIEELDAGAEFEELAEENSTDGSAAEGGDLGYFGPGQMIGEFEEAAFAMEVGSHSETPVESQFGWHVIKLEDRREQTPPSFEEVSTQIRSLMLREAYLQTVADLREAAEVEISDPALRDLLEGGGQVPADAMEGGAGEAIQE